MCNKGSKKLSHSLQHGEGKKKRAMRQWVAQMLMPDIWKQPQHALPQAHATASFCRDMCTPCKPSKRQQPPQVKNKESLINILFFLWRQLKKTQVATEMLSMNNNSSTTWTKRARRKEVGESTKKKRNPRYVAEYRHCEDSTSCSSCELHYLQRFHNDPTASVAILRS